jgi:hypothetical protein
VGEFISLGYREERRRRGAEPLAALEMRAQAIGWAPLAAGLDRIVTFAHGRYMSFVKALAGTRRGRQLDALRGDAEVRLWLDDEADDRAAPAGCVQVTTTREANELLATGMVTELSLRGEPARGGGDVIEWLAQEQRVRDRALWPRHGITLHHADSAHRESMARAIERHAGRTLRVERSVTTDGKLHLAFRQSA